MDQHTRKPFAALCAAAALVVFTACSDGSGPPRAEVLKAQTSTQQEGVVGEAAPVAPSVKVTSAGGQPVSGVTVTFAVTAGGGSLGTATQTTDAAGIATAANWTLGQMPGANTVTAKVAGILTTLTFNVQAMPAAPARITPPASSGGVVESGTPLPLQVIELRDRFDNVAANSSTTVTVSLLTASGSGVLGGTTSAQTIAGKASFSNIIITGSGTFQLSFAAPGFNAVLSLPFNVVQLSECSPTAVRMELDFALGQMVRYQMSDAAAPQCLLYQQSRNQGQQYLVLFENMPLTGGYSSGVFAGPQADSTLPLRLRAGAASPFVVPAALARAVAPPRALHAWDFGAGPIYEIEPEPPPAGVLPRPRLLGPSGQLMELNALTADPVVGDTLVVFLNLISRLGIPSANQKVVVRYISPELIITEDSRLATTLPRANGSFNTPLTQAQLVSIAQEYAAQARVQADGLFLGRINPLTEATNGGRVIAVHSLMNDDNIWGYTYSTGNYFVWDFWVGVPNGATAGFNQLPQRVADDLFMHEIAHMRHAGLIQRSGLTWSNSERGNQWLVEGFARFTERLPIAARLLNSVEPSRTGNVQLPLNPIFNNSYFRDDVPTFLNAGSVMFDAYQNSSFVFDYFADHVALQGGDWKAAVRDLIVSAGTQQLLDAAVSRWLPGVTFGQLFTRARIALYTDDIGYTLPAWTQYLQYQLRTSRPAGSQAGSDPRTLWPKLTPGSPFDVAPPGGSLFRGAAYGYVVDGTQPAAANATIIVEAPKKPNGVISITRIR